MRPSELGLVLAVVASGLLACNGGIGVTDASSYSSTTQNPSSDPSNSNSDSNSDPTTTTSGTGTGSGSSGSGESGESSGVVTSGPTSGSSTGDTGSGTTSETTGGLDACLDLGANDYGDCDAFLGYAYDGTSCRAFSGCDCGPDCANFFASALDCATSCAALGGCNEAAIQPAFLAMGPIGIGSYCDQVDTCAVPNTDAATWLAMLFPGLNCEGVGACKQGEACQAQFAGMIDAAQWEQLCAASLLPNAELYCVVFGP